ncbi:MAG TPA: hypothetical protein VFS00_20185 [Polyangiaceae bacterium]|nr:hypothetical protein [Polyangiaceae bacterium]
MNDTTRSKVPGRSARKPLLRGLVAALAFAPALGAATEAQAADYVDYWGDDLFGGIAYHRFGCYDNDATTISNQDYDGFTTQRYCFAGRAWDALEGEGYVFLDWNYAPSRAQLDACGQQANQAYGTPDYAPDSVTCDYNIFTDCNSDCWIREFSSCQGWEIGIASPCF